MAKKTLKDVDLKNKKVIIRVDYNVPINGGKVTSNKRIVASLPTIQYALKQNAAVILLSHLGRVESLEDVTNGKKSLAPVVKELKKLLPKVNVKFVDKSVGTIVENSVKELKPGEILLLENTRYNDVDEKGKEVKKESKNDKVLGAYWAKLGDVFVNDAFGTAHRNAASNTGIASAIKTSCVGFLIQLELENLAKITEKPKHPVVAILGGSKVSDKLAIIENLIKISDKILIVGGMANTFLTAQGQNMGSSKVESDLIATAKAILKKDTKHKIVLPVDFLTSKEFKDVKPQPKSIGDDFSGLMALDIGKKSIDLFAKELESAKTVFWNGPAGVFEFANYAYGTKQICNVLKTISKKGTFTLIGGGDSAAAALSLGFKESDFGFISTGGGASLEFIEGKVLPGVASIQEKK